MRKLVCCLLMGCFLLSAAVVWGQWGTGSFSNDPFGALNNAFNKLGGQVNLEEDYYLGRAVAANILSMPNYRLYTANPGLTNYLNRICQTLVINSSNPSIFNGYHVAILDTQEYNAFATPGGHIMLTKGLVEAAASEDALAAIIAHELAHINLRHAAEIIEGMSLVNQAGDMADRAAALTGNSRAAQQAQALRQSVAPIVDTMIKNGFSQAQEFDADRKALEILDAAGYDPQALLEILQILQRVQPNQRGGFNSTHPSPRDRIANVNSNISGYRPNSTQSYRQPRFSNR